MPETSMLSDIMMLLFPVVTSHVGQHSLDWELNLQGVAFRMVVQDLLEMPW